ncbi:MAG: ArnT family glycosyltransferase [Bacteroidota bacterium]
MNIRPPRKQLWYLAIILVVAWLQLFCKLGELPVRLWDESRNAVSAREMFHNGNYLVKYYDGRPDNWELKPPLLLWHQVLFLKLFGPHEWAIRLPSALYALLTVLLLFRFSARDLKSPETGLLAALVLLTSYGYLDRHIARTGDHDAMLTFFLTFQTISFFRYLNAPESRNRHLSLFTLSLVASVYAKGIAGMFFLPGFLLYTVISGRFLKVLRHGYLYVCIAAFLLLAGGYYAVRELSLPGYLKAVWENEMLPRYTNQASNFIYKHQGDRFFYLRGFRTGRFVPWIWGLVALIPIGFLKKHRHQRPFFLYLLLTAVAFLVIISMGTKNIWYDAPLFPLLALLFAMGFVQLSAFLSETPLPPWLRTAIPATVFFALILFSLNKTKGLTFQVRERAWAYEEQGISYYLRELYRTGQQGEKLTIAYHGTPSHIHFYMNLLNENNNEIRLTDYHKLEPGIRVISCQKNIREYLEAHYRVILLSEPFPSTALYSIEAVREPEVTPPAE